MLVLSLDRTDDLLDAILIILLSRLGSSANLKCSPAMFSLTVSHHSPDFVAALEMEPQFFNHFSCDQISNSLILLRPFFNTITRMKISNFFSMDLSIEEQRNDYLLLQFRRSGQSQMLLYRFPLLSLSVEEDADQINFRTYVSIDSIQFRRIVTEFNGQLVVTLTESQVKFSIGMEETILTKEGRQCIIEGVTAGDAIEFVITLHPNDFFLNMTSRSEKIWLFKTTNYRSIVVAPIGLHAHFSVYFPG